MRLRHSSQALLARCTTWKGVHDCLCVGEFFGGGALEPGESIHCDDLDTAAPGVGLGGEPGFEDLFGAGRDHVQEPGGAAVISDGRHVQDDGDEFVAVWGVGACLIICVSVFCLKGLMHDE